VAQATMFMLAQALVGFLVLIQFNHFTVLTGLASLLVVVIYPFMKRITYWPQIFLGLAFSWGALMGWPAEFARLDWPALVLYAGSTCWVIGYDTIYAHQDREDDLLIGIKSTALLFGERTPSMLAVFYACAVVLIAAAGFMAGGGVVFALGLIAFAGHLAWQVTRLDIDDPAHCLKLFKSNRDAGLILFGAMLVDAAVYRTSVGANAGAIAPVMSLPRVGPRRLCMSIRISSRPSSPGIAVGKRVVRVLVRATPVWAGPRCRLA